MTGTNKGLMGNESAEGQSPGVRLKPAEGPGVWKCPSDMISSPFLARKGVSGLVERLVWQPDNAREALTEP